MKTTYSVYFIECIGGIYIGVARDVEVRYKRHVAGQGALYTKTHPPIQLMVAVPYPSRAEAMRVEKQLKKLRPVQKIEWAADHGWEAPDFAMQEVM